ncbi:catechol 2,3-dioxygenase-like lactoylglutathione lyase family enzyme [Kineosphaera limosa]|uniref:VOC domain-containing protein n=1 Tax=Kineosphaera limosa NBRC 100340 TaxID=1184609 RepID=K6XFH3_9MICO|nr:VOC family protein [Kineosphaera limosa]NYE01166.1 catechol 2,3-dioxygenase-like lactoylglutathione lyase family enzyme [Kineosphaera limosa]GAB97599.1 hypothetical protein KILIM_075_00180 [Kineosphaera limosa NBRC 100340]
MTGITGIKLIKLPVRDLRASARWYHRVFGATPVLEFADIEDGVVRGLAMDLPGLPDGLALRESPGHAAGVSGFNLAVWSVTGEADIDAWMQRLDQLGVDHSPKILATTGWLLLFSDPDGIEHHVYTSEPHGIDRSDEPRAGRPARVAEWV